jgi:hypothetical protein
MVLPKRIRNNVFNYLRNRIFKIRDNTANVHEKWVGFRFLSSAFYGIVSLFVVIIANDGAAICQEVVTVSSGSCDRFCRYIVFPNK